ncbi:MAG TPA: alkaline phosphatase family protein [Acidobacteriaceae bacterium]
MKTACTRALLTCLVLSALIACGSQNSSAPPQSASPTISSVAPTCSPSSVATGATSQCSANVQGTGSFSTAVTWSVSGGGSITSGGLFTAPSSAVTASVTATSTQDTTKSGTASITVQAAAPPPPVVPESHHVVLVMEENQSYSTVVGATTVWPNLNSLIARGALPTNYYADSHPSIGNYFMLTTGQLLTTDDNSTQVFDVDNIARRMLSSGVTFRIYAEGITQGYTGGNTGLYLIRHNPFAMLSDVAGDPTVANQVLCPFSQFATDLANNALPDFSYIVPDVDDDAHDGTPQQADTWLQANIVTPLSGIAAFKSGGDGLLIVDFDEAADSDTTHGGGHISPVLWGPNVKAGFTQTSTTVYQHESMLRTIMEALSLQTPPGAAANAPSMTEFFVQ